MLQLAALPFLLSLAACGGEPAAGAGNTAGQVAGTYRSVDVPALKAALDAGQVPLLLDVRTPAEFSAGHVPGAKNIPLGELKGRLAELAPNKEADIYLICEVGGRSASAGDMLEHQGFKAVNVQGGTAGWRAAGLPTE